MRASTVIKGNSLHDRNQCMYFACLQLNWVLISLCALERTSPGPLPRLLPTPRSGGPLRILAGDLSGFSAVWCSISFGLDTSSRHVFVHTPMYSCRHFSNRDSDNRMGWQRTTPAHMSCTTPAVERSLCHQSVVSEVNQSCLAFIVLKKPNQVHERNMCAIIWPLMFAADLVAVQRRSSTRQAECSTQCTTSLVRQQTRVLVPSRLPCSIRHEMPMMCVSLDTCAFVLPCEPRELLTPAEILDFVDIRMRHWRIGSLLGLDKEAVDNFCTVWWRLSQRWRRRRWRGGRLCFLLATCEWPGESHLKRRTGGGWPLGDGHGVTERVLFQDHRITRGGLRRPDEACRRDTRSAIDPLFDQCVCIGCISYTW